MTFFVLAFFLLLSVDRTSPCVPGECVLEAAADQCQGGGRAKTCSRSAHLSERARDGEALGSEVERAVQSEGVIALR